MSNTSGRKPAMDIVRLFALFFVNSVHSFLYSSYYSTPITGIRMSLATAARGFFLICVPLFLMLSGYLLGNKRPEGRYYAKLPYTVGMYLLAASATAVFRCLYYHKAFSLSDFAGDVLSFDATYYGWYVEMYLGLFLLCPLLNVLYDGLKDRRQKNILLISMLLLTSLPLITNIFVADAAWFLRPSSATAYGQLLPDFWTAMYPITYYLLGRYLREYKLPWRPRTIALLSAAVLIVNGLFHVWRGYGEKFIWGSWQNYASPLVMLQAVLFFAFFDNLSYDKFPPRLTRLLQKLSGLCYGGYLISGIFDIIIYVRLELALPDFRSRLPFLPLTVLIVYPCSLALSYVLDLIYRLIAKGGKTVWGKLRRKALNDR